MSHSFPVSVRHETVVLPTYEPRPPDINPMFLEKRVYQGSSGRIYPLHVIDRIAEKPASRAWRAIFIENEFVRVMLLPELGGRIHRIQDKTNGYDAIYHQPVIKPALVGLAGPWCSGGIEFNWPQHHRPSTFMPTDVAIERHDDDGTVTVWMSEHDPMSRMKGMHGIRLHRGRSWVEVVVRVYNRTADVQTFLWWANIATRVHENYQSFFPPDVTCVADHAKRAITTFPRSTGIYYGIDYAARARNGIPESEAPRRYQPSPGRPDDLSWYANIPVPTSYMCVGSSENFFGGYDHKARAGLIHVANHHIAPGKKQWTWGNHEFGYAWDRNLTDADADGEHRPYIELMAGVYTDNQPDFSFLQPGETKTWSQFWYPIRAIGPAHQANVDAAVSLHVDQGMAHVGVAVTAVHRGAIVRLEHEGRRTQERTATLAPDRPLVFETPVAHDADPESFTLRVLTRDKRELISCSPKVVSPGDMPAPAAAPALPAAMKSTDELFLTGLHLEQYRHATRLPEDYWREALHRDPGDARCNLALGRWHLRRGEFVHAEKHLRASIGRITSLNANPYDGEAHYQLGLCLRLQAFAGVPLNHDKITAAYAAFYKATWNHAWQSAGFHALAEIDCLRGEWITALDHLDRALRLNADNLRARDLKAIVLRRMGRGQDADNLLTGTLELDPLDWWAIHLSGKPLGCDNQVRFDIALDCTRAGLFRDALDVLAEASQAKGIDSRPDASLGTAPMVPYYRAWICHALDDPLGVRRHLTAAARENPDYCFPARLEEIAILEYAIAANPRDARAPFFLGHLLYDRRRHREGMAQWERAIKLEPGNAVAWRNLGLAAYNVTHDPTRACAAYDRALRANPGDARLLFERDQLWKRVGLSPAKRLRELLRHPRLVQKRDDLSVELCALYNQTGRPAGALAVLSKRKFQPWEGGEGQALGQYVRAHLALGHRALHSRKAKVAIEHFTVALVAPENLGEAKHLLANQSDIHFLLGCALAEDGRHEAARQHWTVAAEFNGNFQDMRLQTFSEMTYHSAMALERLGRRRAEARRLLQSLLVYARQLAKSPATIDYFATSLPAMLLFDEDLQARQATTALFLEAQSHLGLGRRAKARAMLRDILRRDPNHAPATDLITRSGTIQSSRTWSYVSPPR